MQIYGLTGGLGSGKSEAGRRLAESGFPVIDADDVGHAVLEPGGAAAEAVLHEFGDAILTGGVIDRGKLADLAFGDLESVVRLNRIVHPSIMTAICGRLAALCGDGRAAAIVEAALIGEGGRREPWLEGLILVLCREEVRLERLTRLRGMDEEQARRRMAAQTSPDEKAALADWVIRNEGSLDELHRQVDAVARAINERSGAA